MATKEKEKEEKVLDPEEDRKERVKALDSAIRTLEKAYGKNSVMRLGDHPVEFTPVLPTGILELDLALGVGGIPRGRITEIYGPESSGKTTVALHLVAETQRSGGICAFIDAEHALDPIYARALGVDTDNLYVSQPNSGEEALDIAEALGRSGALDLIVVDSVAALVPKAEIEGQMGDSVVGVQARLMSKAMRKLAPVLSKSDTAMVFINQLRLKVGVVYGNPEVTSGGNALKYYATVRLDVRKGSPIKKGDEVLGHVAKIKVAKNKVAPPLKTIEADMYFGRGVDRLTSIINTGIKLDVISKSGAWLYFDETRLGQGKDNARALLLEDPALAQKITDRVYAKFKGEQPQEGAEEAEASSAPEAAPEAEAAPEEEKPKEEKPKKAPVRRRASARKAPEPAPAEEEEVEEIVDDVPLEAEALSDAGPEADLEALPLQSMLDIEAGAAK